ncbi:hypothetical protein CS390_15360 [Pseudomonas sp. HLS-6]|uniref:hypothetical protein n=1 Tax=Pseudomonas sp. HLS-6 TaxID=2049589 RepID=UPI000C184097|nr:hypothetical protein [Pseudomonas sp. HLS-6]ATR83819.1 hypothetical protein CS390_15360 [Pseudomonas sp. HLS-6]
MNLETLKTLAERVMNDRRFCCDEQHRLLAEGVLALFDENEALRKDAERSKRMLLDACVSIGSIGEALGLDMDADADMMIGTARDLIDGLNRIIKECPLGTPGFAIATEVLGELGVQQEAQP